MKVSADIRKQRFFKKNIGVFVWLPNQSDRVSVPPYSMASKAPAAAPAACVFDSSFVKEKETYHHGLEGG